MMPGFEVKNQANFHAAAKSREEVILYKKMLGQLACIHLSLALKNYCRNWLLSTP